MTTPKQPNPNTGKTLEPSKFTIKKPSDGRVYPSSGPDDYGQVHTADKDKSRPGESPNLSQQAHSRSDADSSPQALHHSLGPGRNQAAPGDHIHDGITSRKLGPMEMDPGNPGQIRPTLTCAATAADIRALLHNFINFRDI